MASRFRGATVADSESSATGPAVRKSRASSASRKTADEDKADEDEKEKKPRSRSRKAKAAEDDEDQQDAPKAKKASASPSRRRSRTTKTQVDDDDAAPVKAPAKPKRAASRSRTKKQEEQEEEQEEVLSSDDDVPVAKPTKVKSTTSRKSIKTNDEPTPILNVKDALLTATRDHQLTRRQPVEAPEFTLKDLRDKLQEGNNLFERPLYKTMYFIIRDVTLCATWLFANFFILKAALWVAHSLALHYQLNLASIAHIHWTPFDPKNPTFSWPQWLAQSPNALVSAPWCQVLQDPIAAVFTIVLAALSWNYVYWMGHFFTGLLIIGHETHHGALWSPAMLPIGHVFGWVFHSLLFIPYFSWGFSHRNHHTFNKNQAMDEAHVAAHIDEVFPSVSREFGPDLHPDITPRPRNTDFFYSFKALCGEIHENLVDFSFPYRVFYFVLYVTIGFPLYLIMNASNRHYPTAQGFMVWANHFDPRSLVFHNGEGPYVIISNIGLALNITWIYYAYKWTNSLAFVSLYYGLPYLHCHFYFVVYTLCHHSSPSLPTYSGEKWNYLQGALSTIDRTHGPLIDNLWHYISRHHVIHHLFSDLPFYHANEATERLKPMLGDYYMFTDEDDRWFGALIALWNHVRDGTFIAEDYHPGLTLVAAAHKASKTNNLPLDHPTVEKAVVAALPQALANDPHKDGRNIDKEIFWQRTLQIDY